MNNKLDRYIKNIFTLAKKLLETFLTKLYENDKLLFLNKGSSK